MANSKDFYHNHSEAGDNLVRASAVLETVMQTTDLNAFAPAEQIAYAHVLATMAVGQALLAQIAQHDQPPRLPASPGTPF